jgi:hypothetical protein
VDLPLSRQPWTIDHGRGASSGGLGAPSRPEAAVRSRVETPAAGSAKKCSCFVPGTLNSSPAERPGTIQDLPEGDTLVFQVTVGTDGPSAFLTGAGDFSERAVRGLGPDLATIAVPNSTYTHRCVPRLLSALDRPPVAVPVHRDDFEVALKGSPQPDPSMDVADFVARIGQASPDTRVVVPDYRTVYDAAMRPVTEVG